MVSRGERLGVVIDPAALLGCLGDRYSSCGAQPLNGRLRFDPVHDEETRGHQTGASDSLAAMDDDISTCLQFGFKIPQGL